MRKSGHICALFQGCCPSKRSCEVTGMTNTSTGLCQISLLTVVPSCRGLKMRENTIMANTRKSWTMFSKELHGCCQMIEDVTRAWHRFYREPSAHFLISESSRSLRRSCIHKQCWCFPADIWTGSLSWSLVWNQLGFNYPQDEEGMQLSNQAEILKCISQNSFQLDTRHSWQLGVGWTSVEISSTWKLLGLTIFVFHWMDSDDYRWCFSFFNSFI